MNKNNKKKDSKNIKKKDQIKAQQSKTLVLSEKKEEINANLNKSAGEIKHTESLFGNNVFDNKSKDPKMGTVVNQKVNLESANHDLGQNHSEQDDKVKIANEPKTIILEKEVKTSNQSNKNGGDIGHKHLLLDNNNKLNKQSKESKIEATKHQKINSINPKSGQKNNNKAEKNEFSIFPQDDLEQNSKNEFIGELKKIFDQYEKAQYKDKALEIFGKDDVSIELLIDCYASDVQGFGDCGPLSILESRSDDKNCRMRDWRFRNFLSDYVTKKLDISFSLPIDCVLKKVGYKKRETQENFLNKLIFDGDFKMLNQDKTDNFYSNQKVQGLREEILNAIDEISKLYTDVIQQNEEYKNIQDVMSFPFRSELIEILNYFPLDGKGNLDSFVNKDERDAAKQELLQSKVNINANILFMALSFIEKKPIFCLMDTEFGKGLYVFDAARISDSKLKHKCIFGLDNNSMDNQIEYPPDLIYEFKQQLGNKDSRVFFFRSKPNHHFQYLEPNNQEKRIAFNNDMNRLFFNKYIERVSKLGLEEQKKLQDELKQKEDLLKKQKAEFQAIQKKYVLLGLRNNLVCITWTSYITYAIAWLFQLIFQGCQKYVNDFRFAKELNQKISEILKSNAEQSDNFEKSIGDLMSYIEDKPFIVQKSFETSLLGLYVSLAGYYSKHNTQNMVKKLQDLKTTNMISDLDFYIEFLQDQSNNKIEQDSQKSIIENKNKDLVNSTAAKSLDKNNKVIPIKALTGNTFGDSK